jgi:ferrous iron transport protein A
LRLMEMTLANGIPKSAHDARTTTMGLPIAVPTPAGPAVVDSGPAETMAAAAAESVGMRLADLATGTEARVLAVSPVESSASADLGRRLAELGFLPGEKLRIVARGFMGREPIAVRIGTGTFALRLFEAACVRVCPELPLVR